MLVLYKDHSLESFGQLFDILHIFQRHDVVTWVGEVHHHQVRVFAFSLNGFIQLCDLTLTPFT